MNKLIESISDKGLMQAPVLKADGRTLVAGERRLKALQHLQAKQVAISYNGELIPPGHIPFTYLADLTEFQLIEAELEENIIREDLTWQERLAAIHKLHQLRLAQNPKQTKTATAKEIEASSGKKVSTALKEINQAEVVAPHLDDPDIAAASSAAEAFKLVARKIEDEFLEALDKKRIQRNPHKVIKGDCGEVMKDIPDESFDLIIADPPYGVGADKFGDFAKMRHKYEDTHAEALNVCKVVAEEGYRVAKNQAHLYIFCDIDLFIPLKQMVYKAGWSPWRTPLVWTKGGAGHAPNSDRGPRRVYELILYASKKLKKIRKLYLDHIPMGVAQDKYHAAEKPVDLYAFLMEHSCLPGDTVLDPCCGSGTVFAAANKQKLIATGIEKAGQMVAVSKLRMKENLE
jgi:site-specific DNA-methyltransferase (adenine-specific)